MTIEKAQTSQDVRKRIDRKKRPLSLLFIGIITLLVLGAMIYLLPPHAPLLETVPYLTTLHVFFLLLFIFLFALGSYLFKNKAHGILVALLVTSCLLFLLNDLRHPFFFVMLFALFLTLELFVSYRK